MRSAIIISGVSLLGSLAGAAELPTSGDPDIDRVRAEVRATPTGAGNYKLRGFLMKQWPAALQQQGVDVEDYLPVDWIPWPNYKGNPQRTGYTGSPGPRAGERAWRFPVGPAWESRPVIENNRVYVASPGMRSDMLCEERRPDRVAPQSARRFREKRPAHPHRTDRRTGHVRWRKPLDGGSDSGAPTIVEGRIYLPVGGNQFRCLDASTSETLWSFRLENTNFNVTPAYHDGRVYISMLRGLGVGGIPAVSIVIALDAATGEPLWRHTGGGLTGPVVGADGRVFIASTTSPLLYCLEGRGDGDGTAKLLWTYRMGDKVEESVPCLYGNLLYILSCDGYLHAVK